MKKGYYTIPIIYILLILLLFYIGFNHTSSTFSIKKGPLTVRGTGQEGLGKNSVKTLTLDIPGLKMNLTKDPLYILDGKGNRTYMEVSGFSFEKNNQLTVAFKNSARLVIKFDIQGSASTLLGAYFSLPSEEGNTISVFLPAQAGYTMKQLSYLSSYTFTERGSEKLYVFPTGSSFDSTAGVLRLSLKHGEAYFSLHTIGTADALSFYFFGSKGPVNRGTYESVVEDFLNRGYNGWKNGRFVPEKVEWLDGKGTSSFSNSILTAYIAESLKRGRYSDSKHLLASVEKHGKDFTYVSAPFAGTIVNTDKSRMKLDDQLKKLVASRSNKDTVFQYEHLIDELKWIASSALFRMFNTMVASQDLSKHLSPATVTGMVEMYRDVIGGNSDQFRSVLKLYPVIESALYPDLVRTGTGLFVQNEEGFPDILLSVKAGKALYDIGQINNDTLMSSIGRTLVVSSLLLQKKYAWLPSYLNRDGSSKGQTGFYGAELFYADLTDNEFYPHLLTFDAGGPENIRIWTAAKEITFQQSGDTITSEISFPRGVSHLLVIKGIPPFRILKMHGIPWNSDRRCQYYTSGWVYDTQERTLYMKLTQRKNKEQIVLQTGN